MRIFNEAKTYELDANELDYTKGHLIADKLFIAHHEAVPHKPAKSAQEIVNELESQGVDIEIGFDDKPYRILEENDGGRIVEPINDIPETLAQDAYDEYEDIQVYVLYTATELRERKLNELRAKRAPLLDAFDKWEKAVLRDREDDDILVMDWYDDLLDLRERAFSNIPERVEYYIPPELKK